MSSDSHGRVQRLVGRLRRKWRYWRFVGRPVRVRDVQVLGDGWASVVGCAMYARGRMWPIDYSTLSRERPEFTRGLYEYLRETTPNAMFSGAGTDVEK